MCSRGCPNWGTEGIRRCLGLCLKIRIPRNYAVLYAGGKEPRSHSSATGSALMQPKEVYLAWMGSPRLKRRRPERC